MAGPRVASRSLPILTSDGLIVLVRTIPRGAFARGIPFITWEIFVALSTGHAVASTLLGRTAIFQASLGWVIAVLSVSALVLIWLESSRERAYSLRSYPDGSLLRSLALVQTPLLLISLAISLAAYDSDYWYHNFVTLLHPAPAVALLLTVLTTAVGQEVILRCGDASQELSLQRALAPCRRWAIPVSLLLLGFLEGSSYLWVIGNDFTRYWAVADAIGSLAGYPASRHQPVYIAAGMYPNSIELPFYPTLLLISFSLFGHDTVGGQIPNLFANTVLPLLLYGLYRRAGLGRFVAFAASCAVVAVPFFRLYTLNAPVPDAVFEALLVGSGYLFLRVAGKVKLCSRSAPTHAAGPWIEWMIFGLVAGLAALTRPDGLLFAAMMFAALVPSLALRRLGLALGTFLSAVAPFSLLMMSTFGLLWPRNQGTSSSLDHISKNLEWLGRYSLRWYADPLGLTPVGFVQLAGLLALASIAGMLLMATRRRMAVVLPLAGALQITIVFTIDPRASGADQWFDFFRHVSYGIPFLLLPVFLLLQSALKGVQRRLDASAHGDAGRLRLVHILALCLLLLSAWELRLLAFPSASYAGLGRQFLTSDVWVSLPDILSNRYELPRLSFVQRDGIMQIDPDSAHMAYHSHDVASHFQPVSSLVTGRGPGYQLSSLLAMLFGALFAFGVSRDHRGQEEKGRGTHGGLASPVGSQARKKVEP